ncbi:MAG: MMPL family transporter [Gammaproteobacteria bacterium]|nr:MMPL family transporter [Gammaproteobacteria bacterium]
MLRVDAGFEKNVPLKHPYMQTYMKYQQQFGGGNRVLVAIEDTRGDIFNPEFFAVLQDVTNRVFVIPGIDRPLVRSLFTPNTRFVEAVEDGLAGGPVIPNDFKPDQPGLERVRENVLKAGVVGRLVANDFSAAMVQAELMAINPETKQPINYIEVAGQLEQVRAEIEAKHPTIKLHIIGFAKVMGDVSQGAKGVGVFFAIAILITAVLVYLYSHSMRLTLLPIACSIIGVIWQLGLLPLLGFGIDPMSILVPFLIFAIGVSHGVQMINAMGRGVASGLSSMESAKQACSRLLFPGGIALLCDVVGFITLIIIEIKVIQDLAITASIGVGVIIFTNLILLPVLLSYVNVKESFRSKVEAGAAKQDKVWRTLTAFTTPKLATLTIVIALAIGGLSYLQSLKLKIGDLQRGTAALHEGSVYNRDTDFITGHFSISVDLLSVIVETIPSGCTYHDVMSDIDRFAWHMANVSGVQSTISLPQVAKILNAGFNEGNLKWRVLPRNQSTLVQSIQYVETSTGLLNSECNVMPLLIFTEDHKAETLERVVAEVKAYEAKAQAEKQARESQAYELLKAKLGKTEDKSGQAALTALEAFRAKPDPVQLGKLNNQLEDWRKRLEDQGAAAEQLAALSDYQSAFRLNNTRFLLATAPVGVMAATNEAVKAAQRPMLMWVYGAVTLLCFISFRSVKATVCVIIPLMLVTLMAEALMTFLKIGVTVSTLPVIALGVGIGVDYGIYIFMRMKDFLAEGQGIGDAYLNTLRATGNAVLFTGLTLAIGVSTWVFSALKFQVDMGILLTFMFLVNMIGAVILIPALAAWLYRGKKTATT